MSGREVRSQLRAGEGVAAESRRASVEQLARATRVIADLVATTAVGNETLMSVTRELERCAEELGGCLDGDPYSGLIVRPLDPSQPELLMPLNPIIGRCSPIKPDVQLRFDGEEVVGSVIFSRRFVGPPNHAHGGALAMLADQIVAMTPLARGVSTVTRALTVRYLRPVPLDETCHFWGTCVEDGDDYAARFEVRVDDAIAIAGDARLVRVP